MNNLNGTHSIDKFIENALYDKNYGYYSKKNPLGKQGDFITAPLISPLFSEMVLVWVISYWINLGKPKEFFLVELGPGDGSFCKTFCESLKKFPSFENSVKIFLFERSKTLIKIQKNTVKNKKVAWIKNLSQIKKGPTLFFGNEFFDSIPIKQFEIRNSSVYEKFVQFKNDRFNKFIFKKVSPDTLKKLKKLGLYRKKGIIEYPLKGLKILETIVKKINKLNGGILLIDYGYIKARGNDTLQSLKSHKKNMFYENIGNADITYLVNFGLLNNFFSKKKLIINKIVSQNFFLKKLGIIERANILSRNISFKEKADLYYRLERLLSEKKMGSLFKVLFASKNNAKFNLGFK